MDTGRSKAIVEVKDRVTKTRGQIPKVLDIKVRYPFSAVV